MNYATAPAALRREALIDLVQRARGGLLVHTILWLLIGVLSGALFRQPLFFSAMAMAFALSFFGRWLLEKQLPLLTTTRSDGARITFLVLLLVNPALWGVAGAASILWLPMAAARTPVLLVLIGVAASGGMALAIDPLVRKLYAPFAVLPPVCAMLATAPQDQMVLSMSALVFIWYIHRASSVVERDYWNAVKSHDELAHHARRLEHLSTTDALTQVANRLHFDSQMATQWSLARRSTKALTVIMIDVDHFKRVNDAYGHPFGDSCLKAIAKALLSTLVRPADLLARYGGEEFVAMLPGTDAQGASVVAARMHEAVASVVLAFENRPVRLTCSIGVHTVERIEASTPAIAVQYADQALYKAKHSGRNQVVVSP